MYAIFPEINQAAIEGNVEKLAVLVRTYYGQPKPHDPRLDLERIFFASGMELQSLPLEDEAALIGKDDTGDIRIVAVVKERERPATEYRYLLAHLLGRAFLQVQPAIAEGEWKTSGLRLDESPSSFLHGKGDMKRDMAQKNADSFACALLLPKGMFSRAMDKIGEVEKVAAFFGVETETVRQREIDLKTPQVEVVPAETEAPKVSEALFSDKAPGVAKAPRSVAAASYKATASKTKSQPSPTPSSKEEIQDRALSRLRELARRIDKDVEP